MPTGFAGVQGSPDASARYREPNHVAATTGVTAQRLNEVGNHNLPMPAASGAAPSADERTHAGRMATDFRQTATELEMLLNDAGTQGSEGEFETAAEAKAFLDGVDLSGIEIQVNEQGDYQVIAEKDPQQVPPPDALGSPSLAPSMPSAQQTSSTSRI